MSGLGLALELYLHISADCSRLKQRKACGDLSTVKSTSQRLPGNSKA
jgi:hypothetical protein